MHNKWLFVIYYFCYIPGSSVLPPPLFCDENERLVILYLFIVVPQIIKSVFVFLSINYFYTLHLLGLVSLLFSLFVMIIASYITVEVVFFSFFRSWYSIHAPA